MKHMVMVIIMSFVAIACAAVEKQLLLQSPVISGRNSAAPTALQMVRGKHHRVIWCSGDQVFEEAPAAMIDQLLEKAHRVMKSDYLLEATVYSEGSCLTLSAFAANPPP